MVTKKRYLLALLIVAASIVAGVFFGFKVAGLLGSRGRSPIERNVSTSTPVVSPTPSPILGTPSKLTVPALKIDAVVEEVGLDAQGRMDVPSKPENVAWYKYGPHPGEAGNAVVAGHRDWYTGPAVFQHLGSLKKGDKIVVADSDGASKTFAVTKTASYPFDQFPNDVVFGPSDSVNLNLITCGGKYDKKTKNYSHRVVVYASLVQ